MVDEARKIRTRVTILLRLRRGFLALTVSFVVLLGVRLLQKFLGFPLPAWTTFAALGPGIFAFLWPMKVRWVRVGERLGLGGKLAGLEAARISPDHPFLPLLLSQITLRFRCLFFPEVLALFPVLALAGLLMLPEKISEPFFLAPRPRSKRLRRRRPRKLQGTPNALTCELHLCGRCQNFL